MGANTHSAMGRRSEMRVRIETAIGVGAAALAVALCMVLSPSANAFASQDLALTTSASAADASLSTQAETADMVALQTTASATFAIPAHESGLLSFATTERDSAYRITIESDLPDASVGLALDGGQDGATHLTDSVRLPDVRTAAISPDAEYVLTIDSNEDVDMTVTVTVEEVYVPKVGGLKLKSGKGEFSASYDAAVNAEGYLIAFQKKGASEWKGGTTSELDAVISGLEPWSKYTVEVCGYFDFSSGTQTRRFYGEWSDSGTVNVIASVGKPTVTATAGPEKATVQFTRGANGKMSQVRYKKVGAKKWTVKNVKAKTKVTLSKLKANKKYAIQVRSYTKFNGKTYYGKWSATKKVTPTINSALIGEWELVSMTNLSASEIAKAKQYGYVALLTVKSNKTAVLDNFGESKTKMTWKKNSRTKGTFYLASNKKAAGVPGTVKGKKLTLVENGVKMVFARR